MFQVGQLVHTEYGSGVVRESSARRVFIVLDDEVGTLNVATGTPGYQRIQAMPECIRECGRAARPGEDDCQPCATELVRPQQEA